MCVSFKFFFTFVCLFLLFHFCNLTLILNKSVRKQWKLTFLNVIFFLLFKYSFKFILFCFVFLVFQFYLIKNNQTQQGFFSVCCFRKWKWIKTTTTMEHFDWCFFRHISFSLNKIDKKKLINSFYYRSYFAAYFQQFLSFSLSILTWSIVINDIYWKKQRSKVIVRIKSIFIDFINNLYNINKYQKEKLP